MKFSTWLRSKQSEDGPLGDLAGDVARDRGLKSQQFSPEDLLARVRSLPHCNGAIDAIGEAAHAWDPVAYPNAAWVWTADDDEPIGMESRSKPTTRTRPALSPKLRFEVFKRDSFTCRYCGDGPPDIVLQVDHVKPVALGGTSEMSNLVTACAPCNFGKGARGLSENLIARLTTSPDPEVRP